jgi:hypothetical protein
MRIHNQQELMEFWEEIYGQVKPVWRRAFLKHDAIKEILTYQSDQIKVAVRRNQKLNDVLKDLYHQSQCKEEFDRKQNPFYDTGIRDQSPSKIEQREIESGRWGRSF